MADVAQQVFRHAPGANVVPLFLHPHDAAKGPPHVALGVGLAHARTHAVADHRLEVKRHLRTYFAIAGAPGEERDQAAKGPRWTEWHVMLPVPRRAGRG
jgi:hypothetical protein